MDKVDIAEVQYSLDIDNEVQIVHLSNEGELVEMVPSHDISNEDASNVSTTGKVHGMVENVS